MSTPYYFTYNGHNYSLDIAFDYSPGYPGVNTLPNGDPGYPDEPDELEISDVSITPKDGAKMPLPWEFLDDFSLFDRIEALCREHLEGLSYQNEGPDEQPDYSGPF